MDDSVFVVWGLALAVAAGLYIWLVTWRVRVYRRRKQESLRAEPDLSTEERLARALDTAARLTGQAPALSSEELRAASQVERMPEESTDVPAVFTPSPGPPLASPASVAELVAGIALPHGLVPLTTLAPRPGAGDRVAFWTDRASADIVGPAMVDELRRIGCEVNQLDMSTYAVVRDDMRAAMMLHADGQTATIEGAPAFPTVPPSVVVELWITY